MEALFFAKVRRALQLIERYEPRRLGRVRRDIAIIAGMAGGPHHYERIVRMIALSWPGVLRGTPSQTAMAIVHEATHARVDDRGIPYEEDLRGRIEGICVRQEAAFARLLPAGDGLADAVVKMLEQPWWTPDRLVRGRETALRADGIPEWLVRIAVRLMRRRLRSP
jgi:hypothetical protein